VPGFSLFVIEAVYVVQSPKEVLLIYSGNREVRHVYIDVPHSKKPPATWYGESVGHYEGDTLVVDTIGLSTKAVIDNYHTPHTEALHVVERYHVIEGGKQLEVNLTIEDPGTFNAPWQAMQHYSKVPNRPMIEQNCSENNGNIFNLPGWSVRPRRTSPILRKAIMSNLLVRLPRRFSVPARRSPPMARRMTARCRNLPS
jgi:hypothetical protein